MLCKSRDPVKNVETAHISEPRENAKKKKKPGVPISKTKKKMARISQKKNKFSANHLYKPTNIKDPFKKIGPWPKHPVIVPFLW